jgi:hypothetical protein
MTRPATPSRPRRRSLKSPATCASSSWATRWAGRLMTATCMQPPSSCAPPISWPVSLRGLSGARKQRTLGSCASEPSRVTSARVAAGLHSRWVESSIRASPPTKTGPRSRRSGRGPSKLTPSSNRERFLTRKVILGSPTPKKTTPLCRSLILWVLHPAIFFYTVGLGWQRLRLMRAFPSRHAPRVLCLIRLQGLEP